VGFPMLLERREGCQVELVCSAGVLRGVGRILFLVVSSLLDVGERTMMMDGSCY
jgi:hypothetical protein